MDILKNKMTEIVEISMGDCRIEFYNKKGETTKPGSGDIIRNWMWQLIGPGIDSKRVVSVEIPKLTYGDNNKDSLKIKVEMEMIDA